MRKLEKDEPVTRTLDSKGWEAIVGGVTVESVVASVISGSQLPDWYKYIERNVTVETRCLELGSGTGAMSAALAYNIPTTVTLLDYSTNNLDFSRKVFAALGVEARFYLHDVLRGFPFDNGSFDVVWSSGLLEHFDEYQIVDILAESRRVTRSKVFSLVPNANSIPYRLGKYLQEKDGIWKWGREEPRFSMSSLFVRAGLKVISETTIAPEHALKFLITRECVGLRELFTMWFNALPAQDLKDLRQGYLLLTIGEKP